jgi:hypothetical protein
VSHLDCGLLAVVNKDSLPALHRFGQTSFWAEF